jgi:glycosyltransferase involved in cell wall biosynthesis
MSYAQPVLVSNVPGMLELVEEGVTGFTFETGNVESLAEKLKSVLKADALRETVAKRGYQKVTELYDWKRIGRLTADAYREVLGESRQPDGGY